MTDDACQAPQSRLQERTNLPNAASPTLPSEGFEPSRLVITSTESEDLPSPNNQTLPGPRSRKHPPSRRSHLPEGTRDPRQTLEADDRYLPIAAESLVRVSTRPSLDPRAVRPISMQAPRSRRARRLDGLLIDVAPHVDVAIFAGPSTSENRFANELDWFRRRSCRGDNPHSVPYRLDTPTPLAVARRRRRFVSESEKAPLSIRRLECPADVGSGRSSSTTLPPRSRSPPTLPNRRFEYLRDVEQVTEVLHHTMQYASGWLPQGPAKILIGALELSRNLAGNV